MTYLWINPVSERMISESTLKRILKEHNLQQVRCREDWCSVVLEKYRDLMKQTTGLVADARCPAAVNLVRQKQKEGSIEIQIAEIEPILLHCARELSERQDLSDGEKIITTPCRILAEHGNRLELSKTRFLSWKDFLTGLGETLEPAPKASPIPPGFFKDLTVPVVSLSGRNQIESYLTHQERSEHPSEEKPEKSSRTSLLLELLFCSQGCHMGDGVR